MLNLLVAKNAFVCVSRRLEWEDNKGTMTQLRVVSNDEIDSSGSEVNSTWPMRILRRHKG
jgi:hypothetical protein